MWNNSTSPPRPQCDEFWLTLTISLPCCVARALLLLPMCVFVFYSTYLHWKPHRSFRSVSHSDIFTLNFAAMEVLSILGCTLYLGATFRPAPDVVSVGLFLYSLSSPGEVLIHSLIYLDCFLAVVYPIAYLKRKQSGIKLRNVCIVAVWVCCLAYVVVLQQYYPKYTTEIFTILVIAASLVVSLCSGFILSVLIQPGPGDGEKVDKCKRKAFRKITTSMVVVIMWFVGIISCLFVVDNMKQSLKYMCILYEVMIWFNMPSNVMLLVLYIQRNGKYTRKK